MGPAGTQVCQCNLNMLKQVCHILGIPLAIKKVAGPATTLEFLGILLDTIRMEARLPGDKLSRIQAKVREWLGKKNATKRDILALVGLLQHAAKMIRPGRTFVHRMYRVAAKVREMDYYTCLNREFRSHLYWWHTFLEHWNGVSFLQLTGSSNKPDLVVQSDASGAWGCEEFLKGSWLQWQWPSEWAPVAIMAKELVPIVLSCAVWGPRMAHKTVLFQCDNTGVVAAIQKGSAREELVMHLLRSLWFFVAHYDITVTIEHIAGTENNTADQLSQFHMQPFFHSNPQANLLPTPLPAELLQIVAVTSPDWTLPTTVQHYYQQGLAPSTQRSYQAEQKRYLAFCSRVMRPPTPTTEETLLMFISHLAQEGLAHTSIKVYLSAVRNLHVMAGLHVEFAKQLTPRLQLVMTGIKKEEAKRSPTRTRLPITVDILAKIKEVLLQNSKDRDNILLWAACCLAFFGFLRCGEFTVSSQAAYDPDAHLSLGDIAVDNRVDISVIQVTIKQSKTDPFHQGVQICLGKTDRDICPVNAMLPYLAIRGAKPGPLFIMQDGSFLTRQRFAGLVSKALQQAGIDDTKYATHSFRIGAATTAKDSGISDVHVKMLGRWKSNAYQLYVRTPQDQLAKLSKQLVFKE